MGNPGHPGRLTYGPTGRMPDRSRPRPAHLDRPMPGAVPVGRGPLRRPRLGERAGALGQQRRLGRTSAGRIFITTNAARGRPGIDPRGSGSTRRSSVDPPRYPTDIYVDPSDPQPRLHHVQRLQPRDAGHAGSHLRGPLQRDDGTRHVHVTLDGSGPHALGDLPVGTIERDEKKGDLYAGTDFGVLRQKGTREPVGHRLSPGLPDDHVPYLKIDQDNRVMYVTTHGFGAWTLKLS